MENFLVRVYSQEDIHNVTSYGCDYTTFELDEPIRKTLINDFQSKPFGIGTPIKRTISNCSSSDQNNVVPLQTKYDKDNVILKRTIVINEGISSPTKENFTPEVEESPSTSLGHLTDCNAFNTKTWAACNSSDSEDNENKPSWFQNRQRYIPWAPSLYSGKQSKNGTLSEAKENKACNSFKVEKNYSEDTSPENSDKKKSCNSQTDLPSRFNNTRANWLSNNHDYQFNPYQRRSVPTYIESNSNFTSSKRMKSNNRSYSTNTNSTNENISRQESYLKDCSSGVGFIDTHCHIDFLFRRLNFKGSFSAFKLQCESSAKFPTNFAGCIAVFCEPVTFYQKYFWERLLVNANVWSAFGCHPHFADTFTEETEELIKYAMENEKVVALGEIGLDYSYKNNVPRELQKTVLGQQIKMAVAFNKPIVIHCRDAHFDCLEICQKLIPAEHPVHRHCFTDGWEEACQWMKAFPNLKFGFTCLILRKDQYSLRQVVNSLPIDKILLETDAPYFKPNFITNIKCAHPGMAIFVAKEVASIKNKSLDDVLIQVRKNTKQIYSV